MVRTRMAQLLPALAAACLALLVAAPAAAAPVVLYGPGLDGPTAADRVRKFLGANAFVNGGAIDDHIKLADDEILLLGLCYRNVLRTYITITPWSRTGLSHHKSNSSVALQPAGSDDLRLISQH